MKFLFLCKTCSKPASSYNPEERLCLECFAAAGVAKWNNDYAQDEPWIRYEEGN